ncbi:MAG TPA: hypothetical protein VK604_06550 [Bryobacteraceae bacterium]|nr:hypothetical protein [Bryobacteraceae bacterium]
MIAPEKPTFWINGISLKVQLQLDRTIGRFNDLPLAQDYKAFRQHSPDYDRHRAVLADCRLLIPPDHVHVQIRNGFLKRENRIIQIIKRAEQPAFLGVIS